MTTRIVILAALTAGTISAVEPTAPTSRAASPPAAPPSKNARKGFVWTTPPVEAGTTITDAQIIRLYQAGKVPHFPATALATESDDVPTIQVFLPKAGTATGASAIVCPGGSYSHLSTVQSEPVGKWLAENGITAFILRYRRYADYRADGPHYLYPVPLEDGQRAIRLIRTNAKNWKLNPDRIIVMGCSAGGHLASWLATHQDKGLPSSLDPVERASTKLCAQVLLSPVSTMQADYSGTRSHFLSPEQVKDVALLKALSAESNVTPETPPAFLWHAEDDSAVGAKGNSDPYAAALNEKKIPVTYVRSAKGGHVKALIPIWSDPLLAWLQKEKLATDAK